MNATTVKPFPMPSTRWQWMGTDRSPERGEEKTVSSLRWFQGHVEVLFTDGGCAGVGHLVNNEAWRYCGTTEAYDNAEALLAAVRAQGAGEEQLRCTFVCEDARRAAYGNNELLHVINGMAIVIAYGKDSAAKNWHGDRTTCENLLAAYVKRIVGAETATLRAALIQVVNYAASMHESLYGGQDTTLEQFRAMGKADALAFYDTLIVKAFLQDLLDTVPDGHYLPDFVGIMLRKIQSMLVKGRPLLTAPHGVVKGVYYVCSQRGGCEGCQTTEEPRRCPNCSQPCIAVDDDGDRITS